MTILNLPIFYCKDIQLKLVKKIPIRLTFSTFWFEGTSSNRTYRASYFLLAPIMGPFYQITEARDLYLYLQSPVHHCGQFMSQWVSS